VRGSKFYEPLLRSEPTGDELATWGAFVDADLVGRYRRRGLPVQQVRPVIMPLRDELHTDYPLATERPLTLGRAVVRAAQTEFGSTAPPSWSWRTFGPASFFWCP
jgi:hypothetical protein